MKEIIIFEANSIEKDLNEIYDEGRIDDLELRTFHLRLQSIRDEARKQDDQNNTHS